MNVDLDAAKRARAEARGERNDTITFGGETFEVPAEIPFEFADAAAQGDWRVAMTSLLNGTAARFFALEPSVDDLVALVQGVAQTVQARSAGESSASRSSSRSTSKTSRRASKPNTAST